MGENIEEIKDVFLMFDRVGDQKIDIDHVLSAIQCLGLNPQDFDLDVALDELPDDRVCFEDFLPIFRQCEKKGNKATVSNFTEAFAIFDLDLTGKISSGQLRHVLTRLGEKLTNEQCDELLKPLENRNGDVAYKDLIKMVLEEN